MVALSCADDVKVDDVNRLQTVQNRALKMAFGLDLRHSTEDLFNMFAINTLPVVGIAYFNLLLLIKKELLSGNAENFLVIRDGRRKLQLKFGRFTKKMHGRDFLCLGPSLYNQLPLKLRELKSYRIFKKELKTYPLERKINFLSGELLNNNKL